MLASILGPLDFAGLVWVGIVLLVAQRSHAGAIKLKLGNIEASVEGVQKTINVVDRAVNGRSDNETTISQDVAAARIALSELVKQIDTGNTKAVAEAVVLSKYLHDSVHDFVNVLTGVKGKSDIMWDERDNGKDK